MLAWTLRTLLIWLIVCGGALWAWQNKATLLAVPPGQGPAVHEAAAPAASSAASNTLSFRADHSGHVMLNAAVNGTETRFLVDTGASFVTLTPQAAQAAGITASELRFTERVGTANGVVRVAPVQLREIRLGQMTMEDVDAVVVETPLNVSLLGMSFLKRLDGYEMRDGMMVMSW